MADFSHSLACQLSDYFKIKISESDITFNHTTPPQSLSGSVQITGKNRLFWKCNRKEASFAREKDVLERLDGDGVPRYICILEDNTRLCGQILLTEFLPYPKFRDLKLDEQRLMKKWVITEYVKLNGKYGYMHGDPHQDNVLVDVNGCRIWFIDNTESGVGERNVGIGVENIKEIYN